MCFGEPGRISTIDGSNATVDTLDGALEVSLMVLRAQHREVRPGDWVLVSLGLAIDLMDQHEALAMRAQLAELHDIGRTAAMSQGAM